MSRAPITLPPLRRLSRLERLMGWAVDPTRSLLFRALLAGALIPAALLALLGVWLTLRALLWGVGQLLGALL